MAGVVVVQEREEPRAATLLASEGMTVETSPGTVDVVMKTVELAGPDLVVLEVVSASRAVLRLCTVLSATSRARLAVFSERATEGDVVNAYKAGADAVICEPMGSHELVARMRALLRRAPAPRTANPDVLTVGPVQLDRARRQLTVRGEVIAVPRKEFDIAEALMCRAGGVVSRAQLVRELWGTRRDTKTLDVQVGRLRSKLAEAEGRQRIITVRGVGYRFAADDDVPSTVECPRS